WREQLCFKGGGSCFLERRCRGRKRRLVELPAQHFSHPPRLFTRLGDPHHFTEEPEDAGMGARRLNVPAASIRSAANETCGSVFRLFPRWSHIHFSNNH